MNYSRGGRRFTRKRLREEHYAVRSSRIELL
jgi:hypothetical protein